MTKKDWPIIWRGVLALMGFCGAILLMGYGCSSRTEYERSRMDRYEEIQKLEQELHIKELKDKLNK